MDAFTLGLLSNDEVIEVNQDALGKQGAPVSRSGLLEVWAKQLEDGSKAVGLFNRGNAEAAVTAKWADLGIQGKRTVRDLWRQRDLGTFDRAFSARVAPHGAVMVKVTGETQRTLRWRRRSPRSGPISGFRESGQCGTSGASAISAYSTASFRRASPRMGR
jgi:hypothetical protein